MFSFNFLMKSMQLLIMHVYMTMNFEKKTFSIFNYYRKTNNNLKDWDVLTFCIATRLRHEKNSNTRIYFDLILHSVFPLILLSPFMVLSSIDITMLTQHMFSKNPMAFRLVNLNIRQPVIYDQSNIKKLYILFYVSWQGATTFCMPFIKIIHHIMHTLVGCRQRFLKKIVI